MTELPDGADEIIRACEQGEIGAAVALMHLASLAKDDAEAEAIIAHLEAQAKTHENIEAMLDLAKAKPEIWQMTRSMLTLVDHASPDISPAAIGTMFDAAVRLCPSASVALHSLGDEGALHESALEIAAFLQQSGFLGLDRDMLDLGCGIGRLLRVTAPSLRSATGLDVSDGMVDEARRRCAGLNNVTVSKTDGRDLSMIPDKSVDTILAVDVFPYLVQSGRSLAQAHLRDTARILRSGGALVILNWSYADGDHDAAIAQLSHGLPLKREAATAFRFRFWIPRIFLLRKTGE